MQSKTKQSLSVTRELPNCGRNYDVLCETKGGRIFRRVRTTIVNTKIKQCSKKRTHNDSKAKGSIILPWKGNTWPWKGGDGFLRSCTHSTIGRWGKKVTKDENTQRSRKPPYCNTLVFMPKESWIFTRRVWNLLPPFPL